MRKRGAAPPPATARLQSNAETDKEATRGKEISVPWVAVKTILAAEQLTTNRNPQR